MALTKAHNRMIEGAAVNVKDFGAVGDGVTDDTAAIQAAIDAGTSIVFPSGSYVITSSITIGSNKSIDFGSATLIKSWDAGENTGASAVFKNSDFVGGNSNIKIKNGSFSLASASNEGRWFSFEKTTTLDICGITINATKSSWAISFKQCNNVSVDSSSISTPNGEIYSDGIHFLGGSNNSVTNCFIDSGDDCISVTAENSGENDCETLKIQGCILKPSGSSAIKLLSESTSSFTISDVVISDILIKCNGNSRAIEIRNNDSGTKRIRNVIVSNVNIDALNSTDISVLVDDIKKISFSNINILSSKVQALKVTATDGFKFANSSIDTIQTASTNAVVVESGSNVQFISTDVIGSTSHGFNIGTVSQVTDFEISSCFINDCDSTGIILTNTSGAILSNNKIHNCAVPITEVSPSNYTRAIDNDVTTNTASTITLVGSQSEAIRNLGYRTYDSGDIVLSGASGAVSFASNFPATNYQVRLTGTANETFWATSRGAGGFTVNSSNGSSTARVFWEAQL